MIALIALLAVGQQYIIKPAPRDNRELERRVWELERAVQELQYRVYALQQEEPKRQPTTICRVSAFGKEYKGVGTSALLAKDKAKTACTKDNHEMHCSDIKCESE